MKTLPMTKLSAGTCVVCAPDPFLGSLVAKKVNATGAAIVMRWDDLRTYPSTTPIYLLSGAPGGFPDFPPLVAYALKNFPNTKWVTL